MAKNKAMIPCTRCGGSSFPNDRDEQHECLQCGHVTPYVTIQPLPWVGLRTPATHVATEKELAVGDE